MGLVCATPTAGSAGCLPAVLTAAIQKLDLSHEEQLDFLFAAGAFGLVIQTMPLSQVLKVAARPKLALPLPWSAAALTLAAGGTPIRLAKPSPLSLKICWASSATPSLV